MQRLPAAALLESRLGGCNALEQRGIRADSEDILAQQPLAILARVVAGARRDDEPIAKMSPLDVRALTAILPATDLVAHGVIVVRAAPPVRDPLLTLMVRLLGRSEGMIELCAALDPLWWLGLHGARNLSVRFQK